MSQSQEADVRPLFHNTLLCGPMVSTGMLINSLFTFYSVALSWGSATKMHI